MTTKATFEGTEPSLFDQCDWLYAFMREHCFRDDTQRIDAALWPDGEPGRDTLAVEVGCGPGTYARRLAARHPELMAVGIDRSPRQIERARSAAAQQRLDNCRFTVGDVRSLPLADGCADAVIASRLLMVLREPSRALAEIHRVLRPGGRCFLAEPCSELRAGLPLAAMRLMTGGSGAAERVAVLNEVGLDGLLNAAPWRIVGRHRDRWYRYLLCEKPA